MDSKVLIKFCIKMGRISSKDKRIHECFQICMGQPTEHRFLVRPRREGGQQ